MPRVPVEALETPDMVDMAASAPDTAIPVDAFPDIPETPALASYGLW